MKRVFDLIFGGLLSIILSPVCLWVWLAIKWEDQGPVLYWSRRIGANNKEFLMPKFRSMKLNTPQVATHLLNDPHLRITHVGHFIRNYSLDEIPQLWSVLQGKMSFVGPRPALYNQNDLISLRTQKGVHSLKPGITGWAQINGRDELNIQEKVELDEFYLKHHSFLMDLKIIWLTFFKVVKKEGVAH